MQSLKVHKHKIMFLLGLFLILAYLFAVSPNNFHPGYTGDLCFSEVTRYELFKNFSNMDSLSFTTQNLRYPFGTSLAFMPWGMEKDILGAFFLKYFPNAKFLFIYILLSFLISYLVSGFLIRKLIGGSYYWLISAAFVLFNIPRHFKFWHHYEFLSLHWLHIGLLLDAIIWKEFLDKRTWNLKLELWRGIALLGMLGTALYFWGPLTLSFLLVRLVMLVLWIKQKNKIIFHIEMPKMNKILGLQFLIYAFYISLSFYWFLPLLKEVNSHGVITQGIDYTTHWGHIFRPLWLDEGLSLFQFNTFWIKILGSFNESETVITVGWCLLIPLILVLRNFQKNKQLTRILPFLILMVVAILYISSRNGYKFQEVIRSIVPFMSFFRVASRWGIVLPPLIFICLLLGWNQLYLSLKDLFMSQYRFLVVFFVTIMIAFEARTLLTTSHFVEPLSTKASDFLNEIKESPGEAVLDLPFCVIGGNASCRKSCPFYEASITSQCLLPLHQKKVFSLYQARLTDDYCDEYDAKPYSTWMAAWKENRCFTKNEMIEFCSYLDHHSKIAAVIIYQDIWTATQSEECLETLSAFLGPVLSNTQIPIEASQIPQPTKSTRLLRFAGRCHPESLRPQ